MNWAIPLLAFVALYTTCGAAIAIRRYGPPGAAAVVLMGAGNVEIIAAGQGDAVIPGGVCMLAGLVLLAALDLRSLLRTRPPGA